MPSLYNKDAITSPEPCKVMGKFTVRQTADNTVQSRAVDIEARRDENTGSPEREKERAAVTKVEH